MSELSDIRAALRDLDDDEIKARYERRVTGGETLGEARVPTKALKDELRRRGLPS